jgi:hypothetical protein
MVVKKKRQKQETLAMKSVAQIIGGAQALLNISFNLQECFEEHLSNEYIMFIQILRVVESMIPCLEWPYAGTGRPPYQWLPFLRGALAKSHFHISKTKDLITRLKSDPNLRKICGFQAVPGKATFSGSFTFLALHGVVDEAHEAMVKTAFKESYVQNVNRDSTAIPAREKVAKKVVKQAPQGKNKREKPAKGSYHIQQPLPVLEQQVFQSAKFAIAKLNKKCSWGCKKNSQGNVDYWRGYKLHMDVSDNGFPLTACVTGANVHDSQLAIPMEKITESRVPFCYCLMDSAYDSKTIDSFIRSRGRVPVIDPNKRQNNARPPLDPAKQERFKIRSTSERGFSDLKDNYIPSNIYVRGCKKVSFVLMAGVVCMAAIKFLSMQL